MPVELPEPLDNIVKPYWRIKGNTKNWGTIKPDIINLPKSFLTQKVKRFILACSDRKFLDLNIECLQAYEQSSSELPVLVGIYFDFKNLESTDVIISSLTKKYGFSKIHFFGFYSKTLSSVINYLSDNDSTWDYTINYIRSSRYNLLLTLWELLGLSSLESRISETVSYVVDLDFFSRGDFDAAIINKYAHKKIIMSWNGLKSANQRFPETLVGSSWKPDQPGTPRTHFTHFPSSRLIKAGFSCFSPSRFSNLFLNIFRDLSIGSFSFEKEPIYMRLCTYYYGDQLSLLLSLQEIRHLFPDEYLRDIGWIDLVKSSIVNLYPENECLLFIPKGKT